MKIADTKWPFVQNFSTEFHGNRALNVKGSVRMNVYLRPCVKYGFQCAEFQKTQTCPTELHGDHLCGNKRGMYE
jgi:hypothetical protein